jgi:RNA polymerase sigma factor (sigma-70 family)|tara:strand:- start:823 stop:1386 length:564 start_codon:yes stop_codon:yes gene_type:complete
LKIIQLHTNQTDLIKKAVKQDRKAQHLLFETFAPKMLSVCRYYVSDVQKAEEVMLNGFFKVFKYLKDYKNEGSFEGWIRRIMVREAISFYRQKKQIQFADEVENYSAEFNNDIDSSIEVAQIQACIDGLPEGYKLIFNMYAIEGYKHNEIAKMLDISEGTSKSQLFKAKKMLQEKINKLNTIQNGIK